MTTSPYSDKIIILCKHVSIWSVPSPVIGRFTWLSVRWVFPCLWTVSMLVRGRPAHWETCPLMALRCWENWWRPEVPIVDLHRYFILCCWSDICSGPTGSYMKWPDCPVFTLDPVFFFFFVSSSGSSPLRSSATPPGLQRTPAVTCLDWSGPPDLHLPLWTLF